MAFEIENGILKKYKEENGVTEVTIPDGIIGIGKEAFDNCRSLTSITIPNSVKSIGDYAFACCTSLTSIIIPDSVTSIGEVAFFSCESLTNIEVSKKNKMFCSLDNILYNKDMTVIIEYPTAKETAEFIIPDSVTSISDGVFYDCTSLKSITISDSVTSIGELAFDNCKSLTNIEVSEKNKIFCSLDSILYNKDMTMLIKYLMTKKTTEFIIPDSVTHIVKGAFSHCTSLKSITIPNSVTSIGEAAFFCCENLKNIEVSEKNKMFCSLDNILYNKDMTVIIEYPIAKETAEFIIPDSVTIISDYAFSGCTNLTSITIPDSVTSIGEWAFSGCISLTSITIPDSVTSIGDSAFYYCPSLKIITIHDNITYIGNNNFKGDTKIVCCNDGIKVSFILEKNCNIDDSEKSLKNFLCNNVNKRQQYFDDMKSCYKIPLALFMTFAYPQETYYPDYLKNNAEEAGRYLIDEENIDLLYRFLEYRFVTKENIDELIAYAVEHTQKGGSAEPQLVLSKYKSDNCGAKGTDTFDKFML
ncbi:MAG: leucine-rich repeat domain-containing protein [Ruminococcus sp.]|nr:leucine-rich repeat domain-containing protein [Ruminococcus sp.]